MKTSLGISTIAIAIAKTGLVPVRIPALGIEFSTANRSAILWILAAVIVYFLIAFVIYASSDSARWLLEYRAALREQFAGTEEEIDKAVNLFKERLGQDPESVEKFFADNREQIIEGVTKRLRLEITIPRRIFAIKAPFEFGLPVLLGLYAIWTLGLNSLFYRLIGL